MKANNNNHLSEQTESVLGNDLELSELAKKLMDEADAKEMPAKRKKKVLSTDQIPKNREDLNKMRSVTSIYNGKKNAGITLPAFGGISLGKEESSLNVYFIETKVVKNENDFKVYGCGYSLHYLFKKVENGINVDNIANVAASAQLNSKKTQVFYSLQTYGISGISLVKFFKPTVNKNFNVEGFGVMQSSIDGIHNILGDEELSKTVRFEPEILRFITASELEQL